VSLDLRHVESATPPSSQASSPCPRGAGKKTGQQRSADCAAAPGDAGIGGREVQVRLGGTKGVERMSSGVTGWRADGPYRTRLPAATRACINSKKGISLRRSHARKFVWANGVRFPALESREPIIQPLTPLALPPGGSEEAYGALDLRRVREAVLWIPQITNSKDRGIVLPL
jgi:hypothetical protein